MNMYIGQESKCEASFRCPNCDHEMDIGDLPFYKEEFPCPKCSQKILAPEPEWKDIHAFSLERPPGGLNFKRTSGGFILSVRNDRYLQALLMGLCVPLIIIGVAGTVLESASAFGRVITILGGTIISGVGLYEALMGTFGKSVLRVEADQATLFCGMGPIGRRRHFNWKEIASIHDADNLLKTPVAVLRHLLSLRLNRGICLDGPRPIRFGTILNERQRILMMKGLHCLLSSKATEKTK